MELNGVSSVGTAQAAYEAEVKKTAEEKTAETKAEETSEAVVYEKSSGEEKKATYSINKMSADDRAALVQQLKEDQAARKQSFLNMVAQMFKGQGKAIAIAASGENDEDSIWKIFAGGDFTVDEAAKTQAQKDIAEDGYWGVAQTSQRLFDFASALAGDDVDKMKQMQEAMEKGFKEATGVWGKDLPEISTKTFDAANKLFEDYYTSKNTVTE